MSSILQNTQVMADSYFFYRLAVSTLFQVDVSFFLVSLQYLITKENEKLLKIILQIWFTPFIIVDFIDRFLKI